MEKNVFIVKTENYVTRMIAVKALKAADNNETVHKLYRKACMNGGKIVIPNINELSAWRDALKMYTPVNKTEGKIYRVLLSNAVRGVAKRETA